MGPVLTEKSAPMLRTAPIVSTVGLVAALGCGGRESETTTGTNSSGASADMDASTVGDARVPLYHRVTAATCPSTRGAGTPGLMSSCVTPRPSGDFCCSTDSDCDGGIDGRCILGERNAGGQCTFDECFTDSKCPSGAPCICRSSPTDNVANACSPAGNCLVDADCSSASYCSPSVSPSDQECGGASPYSGTYYCHTPSDTCIDNSDCVNEEGPSGYCVYDPNAKHWGCSPPPGCVP